VIAGGVAAFVIAEGGGSAPTRARKPARVHPLGPPTVQVAVLNAGTQQGAAGALATQLRGEHVNVGTVGNVSGAKQSGLVIMYSPGQNAQAQRLAQLLSFRHPTVAAIDPATAAAAGTGTQLVVVIG
jgi:hypothetical protein